MLALNILTTSPENLSIEVAMTYNIAFISSAVSNDHAIACTLDEVKAYASF